MPFDCLSMLYPLALKLLAVIVVRGLVENGFMKRVVPRLNVMAVPVARALVNPDIFSVSIDVIISAVV